MLVYKIPAKFSFSSCNIIVLTEIHIWIKSGNHMDQIWKNSLITRKVSPSNVFSKRTAKDSDD
jgi:hypothetical protein